MDLRKWFLQQDRPSARSQDLVDRTKHVPCSDFRSPSVLRLFEMGYYTGFMLTDNDGQPTMALEMMANLMGVELCMGSDLPPEEQRAFLQFEKGTLMDLWANTWYLRGLTLRIRNAFSSLNSTSHGWVWDFLPGLDGAYARYQDPDGKRRKRKCYVASCRRDWRMTDLVYEGVFKWTYEHYGPRDRPTTWRPARWPDAYTLLGDRAALRQGGSTEQAERPAQAPGTAPGACVPPAVVCAQNSDAAGHTSPSGD